MSPASPSSPTASPAAATRSTTRALRLGTRTVATAIAFALLITSSRTVAAQDAAHDTGRRAHAWELRFTSGALVGTGSQRDAIKDAPLSAVQLAWLPHSRLAITGTLGWARSRHLPVADSPKLNIFTSDLGLELRPSRWFARRAVSFDPFVGAGAGVRSYDYRSLDVAATSNAAGYVAVGGEAGVGRIGVRLEVRDYVSGFRPLVGAGTSRAGNDVVVMAGLRFNRRRAAQ